MTCPPDKTDLKHYVEMEFNSIDTVEYRCEGCSNIGHAARKQRLISNFSSKHLIIVLDRSMDNINNEITATSDVVLSDSDDIPIYFTPISVIKYEGKYF